MKTTLPLLISIVLFLAGCAAREAAPPPLLELSGEGGPSSCEALYTKGRWNFVHSIDFSMKNVSGSTVIGVCEIGEKSIQAALLTLEGFTLFEASGEGSGTVEVQRAVTPFDKPGFAAGLLETLAAVFRRPEAVSIQSGQLEDGQLVCRYLGQGGKVVDVLPEGGDCWQRKEYSGKTMERVIVGRNCKREKGQLIAERLELQTFGKTGYTLNMRLISADRLK